MNISSDIDENIRLIEQELPMSRSFDIVGRDIDIGGLRGYILFVDGLTKDDAMIHIIKSLQSAKDAECDTAKELMMKNIPYTEAELKRDIDEIITQVLSGQIALFADGKKDCIVIDARQYPKREPEESFIEKVTRGSRDDLVETLVFNTALIRRRIKDKSLTFEMNTVGSISKTDVAIGYIDAQVDHSLLKKVKKRINDIDIHALTMGERSLEELLVKRRWYNPMPQFRISERPDIIAAHLMEGHIVIIVDYCPSAIIIPSTFFYFSQYVEDYYQAPIVGNITRFLRMLAGFASLFLVPLFLLMTIYPDYVPSFFQPLVPEINKAETSMLIQVIVLEISLEFLQLSSLHIPTDTESAFSIIGSLILGDFAVQMGLLIPDSIFFTVGSTVANDCIPAPELADAFRVFRWFMILCTGIFGIWGFGVSAAAVALIIATTKTIDSEHKYLWPLIPFNLDGFKHIFFRYPLRKMKVESGRKK